MPLFTPNKSIYKIDKNTAENIEKIAFLFRYTSLSIITSNKQSKYTLFDIFEKVINDENISIVLPRSVVEKNLTTYNIENFDWLTALNSVYIYMNGSSNLSTPSIYSIKWLKNTYLDKTVQVMKEPVFKFKYNTGLFKFEVLDIAPQLKELLNNYIV